MASPDVLKDAPSSSLRVLRSTPSRARAKSDSERTMTLQAVKGAQSPASVRKGVKITAPEGQLPKAMQQDASCSEPMSHGSDLPIQAKVRKVGSMRKSLGPGEDAVTKTSKRKVRSEEKEALPCKKVRRANPGVRVVGGKVYDSENGTTCHQCRQKTLEVTAVCKQEDSRCKRGFCSKCLFNRYGEKVDEVSQLDTWLCPYCRGLCNCSNCRKRKGLQATGILAPVAKANGFDCVATLLQTAPKASQPSSSKRILQQTSPNSAEVPNPKDPTPDASKARIRIAQKTWKLEGFQRRKSSHASPAALSEQASLALPALVSDTVPETPEPVTPPSKRLKAPGSGLTPPQQRADVKRPSPHRSESGGKEGAQPVPPNVALKVEGGVVEKKKRKKKGAVDVEALDTLPRPASSSVDILHGVLVPAPLVGDVLQILEFLATFAEVVELPHLSESKLLHELLEADKLPRGDRCTLGQVQARLLSLVVTERGEAPVAPSRWMPALHAHVNAHPLANHLLQLQLQEGHGGSPEKKERVEETPESGCSSEAKGTGQKSGTQHIGDGEHGEVGKVNGMSEGVRILDALADQKAGYGQLSAADRVFLLKLLCDDALETAGVRAVMESALSAAEEAAKQQRKGAAAAREEVKDARAKLREIELTQLLGLKGERTPLSPASEAKIVAAISEQAAKVSAAVAAAKRAASGPKTLCPEAVECRAMRLTALGGESRGVQYWKLAATDDLLMSQELAPQAPHKEQWLQSASAEIAAFATELSSLGAPGKRFEAKLKASFPAPGPHDE